MPKGKHHKRHTKKTHEATQEDKPQTWVAAEDKSQTTSKSEWSVISNQDVQTVAQRTELPVVEENTEASTIQSAPEKTASVDPRIEEVENAVMSEVMEHKTHDMMEGATETPEDLIVRLSESEDGMRAEERSVTTDGRDGSFAIEETTAANQRPVEPISVGDIVMKEEALKAAEAECLPEPPREKSINKSPVAAESKNVAPVQKSQGQKSPPARAPLATLSAKENTPLQRPVPQLNKEAHSPKADCTGPLARLIHRIFH